MLVVVCNPGQQPAPREIDDLEALQACVGGWVQMVPLRGTALDAFCVYVNEDGLRLEQAFNGELGGHSIVGPIVVSKTNAAGYSIALTLEEAAHVLGVLRRGTRAAPEASPP